MTISAEDADEGDKGFKLCQAEFFVFFFGGTLLERISHLAMKFPFSSLAFRHHPWHLLSGRRACTVKFCSE